MKTQAKAKIQIETANIITNGPTVRKCTYMYYKTIMCCLLKVIAKLLLNPKPRPNKQPLSIDIVYGQWRYRSKYLEPCPKAAALSHHLLDIAESIL